MIHLCAQIDGEETTALARASLLGGRREEAAKIFEVLCDIWKNSTLLHAQEEESGWYLELSLQAKWRQTIADLTLEHALLRKLYAEVENSLLLGKPLEEVLVYADEFLELQRKHSEHEEKSLLSNPEQE